MTTARSRTIAAWALAAVLGSAAAAHAQPVAMTDDTGRKVALARPAMRIVSLAPFLTELAYSAGAGQRLVAVSAHSDWPPEAATLPQVATATALSLESIAALQPDLVLAWQDSIRPQDVERLGALGIAVFVAQAHHLDDPPRLLQAVARLAGRDASAAARDYRARIAAQRARHAGRTRVSVLVEIWHEPLTTIAGSHWINEALALCGARNAFDDLPGIAPTVPWELVHARAPQAIVGAGSAADARRFAAAWAPRRGLPAVDSGRLVFVPGDLIQRPGLRLAEGVERLCAGVDGVRRSLPAR